VKRFLISAAVAAATLAGCGQGGLAGGTAATETDWSGWPDGPLAPARAGKVQCYNPDRARKTCAAIGSYAWNGHAIINRAQVLLHTPPGQTIIMTMTGEVTVKDGVECGVMRAQDVEDATFTVNGDPMKGAGTNSLAAQVIRSMSQWMDRPVCATYSPDGDMVKATPTDSGGPEAAPVGRFLWVDPSDGYRVAR
jgi:hypothetical protein